jgi:hypothetical protein
MNLEKSRKVTAGRGRSRQVAAGRGRSWQVAAGRGGRGGLRRAWRVAAGLGRSRQVAAGSHRELDDFSRLIDGLNSDNSVTIRKMFRDVTCKSARCEVSVEELVAQWAAGASVSPAGWRTRQFRAGSLRENDLISKTAREGLVRGWRDQEGRVPTD